MGVVGVSGEVLVTRSIAVALSSIWDRAIVYLLVAVERRVVLVGVLGRPSGSTAWFGSGSVGVPTATGFLLLLVGHGFQSCPPSGGIAGRERVEAGVVHQPVVPNVMALAVGSSGTSRRGFLKFAEVGVGGGHRWLASGSRSDRGCVQWGNP
jgi:hypothetical protein